MEEVNKCTLGRGFEVFSAESIYIYRLRFDVDDHMTARRFWSMANIVRISHVLLRVSYLHLIIL